jgi:hypothetical protein
VALDGELGGRLDPLRHDVEVELPGEPLDRADALAAGQQLGLGADVADRDGFVVVADVGDGRDLLDEPADARLGLGERRLGGAQAAEVAQEADEQRLAVDVRAGDRELDRDPRAVAAHRAQLEPAAEHRGRARREMAGDAGRVTVAILRWDDQARQAAPAHFGARVAERALRGGVEGHDAALRIHRDDAVQRRLEHRLAACVDRAGVGVGVGVAQLECGRARMHREGT